jgi:hypothetical protein
MSEITNSGVVLLSNVRLSFPHLAEPQRQQGESGERISYNAEFILTPNDPAWVKFMQVVQTLAAEKWKEHAGNVLQMVQQDRKKRCFGWGQEKVNQKTFQVYDGYEGNVFITAGRDKMPQMIDANGQAVDPANTMACQAVARKMYGGCYVNAAIKPWLQENKHGRGIRCDLVAVQFFADGTPFGEGAIDASNLFGATPQVAAAAGGSAPAMPGFPGMPGAPAAPAWGAPQVPGAPPAMPAAPFPQAAVPAGLPPFLS